MEKYKQVKVVKKAAAANKRGKNYQQFDEDEQVRKSWWNGNFYNVSPNIIFTFMYTLLSQSDITYDESEEEDSDDDYRRRPAPPAKKRANFKRTPAKTSPKKGRGRPPAKAAKGRGRPPAKGGRKKSSKYYDSDDDVVYRYVNAAV